MPDRQWRQIRSNCANAEWDFSPKDPKKPAEPMHKDDETARKNDDTSGDRHGFSFASAKRYSDTMWRG